MKPQLHSLKFKYKISTEEIEIMMDLEEELPNWNESCQNCNPNIKEFL